MGASEIRSLVVSGSGRGLEDKDRDKTLFLKGQETQHRVSRPLLTSREGLPSEISTHTHTLYHIHPERERDWRGRENERAPGICTICPPVWKQKPWEHVYESMKEQVPKHRLTLSA